MKNTVRITSGNYRGRSILTPGEGTHPMGERERLALFNMVTAKIAGGRVLDAFAGSGALGIEAFSRGASTVTFVEKSPKAAKIIRENLKNLGIQADVIISDAGKYSTDSSFDLILADPPYDHFDTIILPNLAKLLDKSGIFVLSHPGEAPEVEGLKLLDSRKYAGATISLYSANV